MSSIKPKIEMASRLDLPVFMTSRIPLKPDIAERIVAQVNKYAKYYIPKCPKDIAPRKTHSHVHWNEHEGEATSYLKSCTSARLSGRPKSKDDNWKIPPDRYNPTHEPFKDRKGLLGAYWTPLKDNSIFAKESKRLTHVTKVNLPKTRRVSSRKCNPHKGKFFLTAHDQPATSRFALLDSVNCHRDPDEPGPGHYNPQQVEGYQIDFTRRHFSERICNGHKFYHRSIIPITERFWSNDFGGYRHDPFRYESRIAGGCPCPRKKTYDPNYRQNLERDERLKFRNVRHKRYMKEKFCDPEWKHVIGKGHCHLFMGGGLPKVLKLSSQKKKAHLDDERKHVVKELNRDKYVAHLNTIKAKVESNLHGHVPHKPFTVKFNATRKIITRKQLRNDKKIAFGCAMVTLPVKAQPLTKKQLQKLKMSLPKERRLSNHPITNTPIEDIKPRYLDKSKQKPRLPGIKVNKRIFHFVSLPKPKYLLEPHDIFPESLEAEGYYNRPYNIRDFV